MTEVQEKANNKLTIFIKTADTLYKGEGLVTSKYRLKVVENDVINCSVNCVGQQNLKAPTCKANTKVTIYSYGLNGSLYVEINLSSFCFNYLPAPLC